MTLTTDRKLTEKDFEFRHGFMYIKINCKSLDEAAHIKNKILEALDR